MKSNKLGICPQCEDTFQLTHHRKKYCSSKCRTLAWRDRNNYQFIGLIPNLREIIKVNKNIQKQSLTKSEKDNTNSTIPIFTELLNEASRLHKHEKVREAQRNVLSEIKQISQRLNRIENQLGIGPGSNYISTNNSLFKPQIKATKSLKDFLNKKRTIKF